MTFFDSSQFKRAAAWAMQEDIIWVLSSAVLPLCSLPRWWTHHKNTLVVLDAYNWTWDWIVWYLWSQCSKAIVKLSKETAQYGLEAFDNKYEWDWMMVLTKWRFLCVSRGAGEETGRMYFLLYNKYLWDWGRALFLTCNDGIILAHPRRCYKL